jgi:CP family cyanate transporter-like MFS transporter
MLPAVVRRHFPAHGALLTGVYAVGINAGAGLAAYGTPRLAQSLGSTWRGALAIWALASLLALLMWLVLAARAPTHVVGSAPMPRRSRQAWMAALLFGLQSMVYYGVLAWLAPLYEERGWSRVQAGLLVSYFTGLQVVGAVTGALVVQRTGRLSGGIQVCAALSAAGLLLVAFTPLSAPWLWMGVLGLGIGGMFPLALTVPLARASSVDEARSLTASMPCYGYMLGAAGPFAVSLLPSASGGFAVAYVVLAAFSGLALLVARPVVDRP